jgi:hypothetical protein
MEPKRYDVRETSVHLRRPSQRNEWVLADGKRVNSATLGPPRDIAPYMLVMDLSFSAFFAYCAQKMHPDKYGPATATDYIRIPTFYSLFAPVVWQWNQINLLLNMFDAEDISTEIFIVAMSGSVISLADTTPPCFYTGKAYNASMHIAAAAGGGDDSQRTVPAICLPFVVSYSCMKLLLMAIAIYYSFFSPNARVLAARAALSTLVVIGVSVLFLHFLEPQAPNDALYEFRAVFFGGTFFAIELLCSFAQLPCSLCSWIGAPVILQVPLDLAFSQKRWERLFFITLGNVVARTVTQLDDDSSVRNSSIYLLLPLVTFLIKCQYFDMSSHSVYTPGHAMRVSRIRGFTWALMHVPLIGAVHWISISLAALQALTDPEGTASRVCGLACVHYSRAVITFVLTNLLLQSLHVGDGDKGARRLCRPVRMCVRLTIVLAEFLLLAFAHDVVSSNSYLAISLGILILATAVEAWGKRVRNYALLAATAESGSRLPGGGANIPTTASTTAATPLLVQ